MSQDDKEAFVPKANDQHQLWPLAEGATFGTFDPGRVVPVTRIVHRTFVGDVVEELEVGFDSPGVHGVDLAELCTSVVLARTPRRWVVGFDGSSKGDTAVTAWPTDAEMDRWRAGKTAGGGTMSGQTKP